MTRQLGSELASLGQYRTQLAVEALHQLLSPLLEFSITAAAVAEIRVASIAFAAYLQSSALAVSIIMIGAPVRVKGAYSSRMMPAARSIRLRRRDGPLPRCERRPAPRGSFSVLLITL